MSSISAATVLVSGGLTTTEGPRWHDGALWFSDFFTHRVLRFEPGRDHEPVLVCETPGRPSGLGFMPDGELRIVSMDDCRLLAWNGRVLTTVARFDDLVTGPANDMTIDSTGRAYISNFGEIPGRPRVLGPTSLLTVDPDGDVNVAAEGLIFPNGIVVDETARRLYVVESFRCCITVFDLDTDGALFGRRTWAEFAPDPGEYDVSIIGPQLPMIPDGIAYDVLGHLWVADAKGHGASRVDPSGAVIDFVDTGDLSPFAVALGGADGRDLFLCCAPPADTVDPAVAMRGAVLHARVAVSAHRTAGREGDGSP